MAHEIPASSSFDGLSRKVIQYSEGFSALVDKMNNGALSDSDWEPLEALIDSGKWERVGQFLTAEAETIGWDKYRHYVTQYAAGTHWEGTLRHITEQGNRVILELTERNTRDGVTDHSNTVTVYEFDDAGKFVHLEVYVMPLGKRPAD